jgi:hypothetical protein
MKAVVGPPLAWPQSDGAWKVTGPKVIAFGPLVAGGPGVVVEVGAGEALVGEVTVVGGAVVEAPATGSSDSESPPQATIIATTATNMTLSVNPLPFIAVLMSASCRHCRHYAPDPPAERSIGRELGMRKQRHPGRGTTCRP